MKNNLTMCTSTFQKSVFRAFFWLSYKYYCLGLSKLNNLKWEGNCHFNNQNWRFLGHMLTDVKNRNSFDQSLNMWRAKQHQVYLNCFGKSFGFEPEPESNLAWCVLCCGNWHGNRFLTRAWQDFNTRLKSISNLTIISTNTPPLIDCGKIWREENCLKNSATGRTGHRPQSWLFCSAHIQS